MELIPVGVCLLIGLYHKEWSGMLDNGPVTLTKVGELTAFWGSSVMDNNNESIVSLEPGTVWLDQDLNSPVWQSHNFQDASFHQAHENGGSPTIPVKLMPI